MDLSQRYKQAAEEARWALGLAIFYVIGWCVCASPERFTRADRFSVMV